MDYKVTAIGEILFDVYPDYKKLGGAPFNFIYHVWRLTGNGNFVSRIGDDENGKEILKLLNRKGYDTTYIQVDPVYNTGIVNVELDENKVPTFDIIENRAYDYIELNYKLDELITDRTELLYFGTLAQRNEKSRNTIRNLLNRDHLKFFYDINLRQNYYTKEILSASLKKSSVVKLNKDELELVNEQLIKSTFDLVRTSEAALSEFDLDLLCVTLGAEGAYLFSKDDRSHYSARVENIVDTVGAGDAYAAMLCVGYLNNFELEKINKLASEFAAELCKIKGAIPDNDDLYNKFKEKIKNG